MIRELFGIRPSNYASFGYQGQPDYFLPGCWHDWRCVDCKRSADFVMAKYYWVNGEAPISEISNSVYNICYPCILKRRGNKK